jgi:hypothetical protein
MSIISPVLAAHGTYGGRPGEKPGDADARQVMSYEFLVLSF